MLPEVKVIEQTIALAKTRQEDPSIKAAVAKLIEEIEDHKLGLSAKNPETAEWNHPLSPQFETYYRKLKELV